MTKSARRRLPNGLSIPPSGEAVVWTETAVAVVLVGFVATRVIEEI